KLRAANPKRDVQINIEPHITVHGDARLLTLALQHLLGNAWKFTRKRSDARIEMRSEQRDGKRIVRISDNGAGFDEAYAGRMFGAFQRFHSPKEFEGAGIGLAMVQRIVHRHHGEVRAEGKVGEGATVFLTLG